MTLVINGTPQQCPDGLTVEALVKHLGLAGTPVAVELNKQVIAHRRHADQALAEGDQLEIVTLVGGG